MTARRSQRQFEHHPNVNTWLAEPRHRCVAAYVECLLCLFGSRDPLATIADESISRKGTEL